MYLVSVWCHRFIGIDTIHVLVQMLIIEEMSVSSCLTSRIPLSKVRRVSMLHVCFTLLGFIPWLYAVKRGDRIAQLILERIETPEVEEVDEITESER